MYCSSQCSVKNISIEGKKRNCPTAYNKHVLVIQICLLFPMLIWVCDEISYFVDQRNELVFRFLLRFELSCYAVGNEFLFQCVLLRNVIHSCWCLWLACQFTKFMFCFFTSFRSSPTNQMRDLQVPAPPL